MQVRSACSERSGACSSSAAPTLGTLRATLGHCDCAQKGSGFAAHNTRWAPPRRRPFLLACSCASRWRCLRRSGSNRPQHAVDAAGRALTHAIHLNAVGGEARRVARGRDGEREEPIPLDCAPEHTMHARAHTPTPVHARTHARTHAHATDVYLHVLRMHITTTALSFLPTTSTY